MLVLSRRQGECIQIGKDVVVTVLDAKRGRIRLGIEAPSQVSVHRQEVSPTPVPATSVSGRPIGSVR